MTTTVCTKCNHLLNKEPETVREHIWYNHLCKAKPLPVGVDPYDGNLKPYQGNDLGNVSFTEDKYQFCRDVNDGVCEHFEAVVA